MVAVSPLVKSPTEVKDFKFDWAALTNGSGPEDNLDTANTETISSHTVTADAGLTVDSSVLSDSNTSVVAWLSGGTLGDEYDVECQVVTSASRTLEWTMRVQCRER